MLIDATHAEETRVAVIAGNKLDEYDYENITRKQLKGNIYLVKVTRVEPSLQAAFVDFGGNRHGFLPFPEVHPDYYRIPIADREALLAEERAIAAAQAAREEAEDEAAIAAGKTDVDVADDRDVDDAGAAMDVAHIEDVEGTDAPVIETVGGGLEQQEEGDVTDDAAALVAETPAVVYAPADETSNPGSNAEAEIDDEADLDSDGGEETGGGAHRFRSALKRRYKIQEVIKRNQIMLIQIGKEERGNKGAAVTSYISLPGRYCVLMPNSPRGGGVSRKVANLKDRQRLKKILHDLNIPEGMSVILRTAGVARSLEEIRRDLDYLLRLWDQIRELTLKSTAPALIYEEGNLIKRAIRDLYRRDISEVHVAGEEAFKTARDFMNTLMPSHVDRIHFYNDTSIPLFSRHMVERQIDEIHNPTVHLKSGGYIVINPTEALVSIDVNSGRATKGRHIEETALKTNLEAADEIARQLRLRDQGGLIVIDFIDMEDRKGNRIVERRLRDAMASDRARIQLGRISPFGLLELSRQRLHPSLVESNFETCAHCEGRGIVRTVETAAVMILRAIEEEAIKSRSGEIKVHVPTEVAIYILNNKRVMIAEIERRHGQRIYVHADDDLIKPQFKIESLRQPPRENSGRIEQRLAPVQTVDMSDLPALPDSSYADDRTVAEENMMDDDRGTEMAGDSDGEGRDSGDRHGGRGNRRGGRHGRRGGRHGRGGDDRSGRGERHHHGRDRHDRHAQQRQDHHAQQGAATGETLPDGAAPQGFSGTDDVANFAQDGQAQGQAPRHDQNGRPDRGDRNDRGGRRRGRRGGRRRGGGRDDRPQQGGGQESQAALPAGDAVYERPAQSFARNDDAPAFVPQVVSSPAAEKPQSKPTYQSDTPPVVSSQSGEGDKNRKGWWKRLTE
jgi:ribonuclease E